MTLYEVITDVNNSQFPLFFLILFLAILILLGTKYLLKISAPYFFLGIFGIILGLGIGSIISAQFTKLPGSIGLWFPPILNIFITVAFFDLFLAQGKSLSLYIAKAINSKTVMTAEDKNYVIDSNVLIDGRIEKIVETNIISGKFLISNLVIQELRTLADDNEPLKRIAGRYGLEMIENLNKSNRIIIEICQQKKSNSIDDSLVKLALERNAKLITNDLALSKIASIAQVASINIFSLTEALKPILTPGQEIELYIHEAGKTKDQGIGYLSDGTMVVVKDGRKFIGQKIKTNVEKIHQTATGRIVFTKSLFNSILEANQR